jgi:hypothetical protein
MVEEWVSVLANYGFPVFMVLWFMFRQEKVLNKITEAMERNSDVIERLWAQRKI